MDKEGHIGVAHNAVTPILKVNMKPPIEEEKPQPQPSLKQIRHYRLLSNQQQITKPAKMPEFEAVNPRLN